MKAVKHLFIAVYWLSIAAVVFVFNFIFGIIANAWWIVRFLKGKR